VPELAVRDRHGAVLLGVRLVTAQGTVKPLSERTLQWRSDGRVCVDGFCCRIIKARWDVETEKMMMTWKKA
jgi:hypothetical protein